MTISYNEIAALLVDGSAAVGSDDHRDAGEAADAIMAALSLTRLREYVRLHLTIGAADEWTIDSGWLGTNVELGTPTT